ncbi:phosphate acyltransferase PlsX [Sphingomonas sp. AP4-R1]|uniref:phosphate acyltransferase PlsX n=1 Tax=Sphingomonas sp. AP4-R1 TaxID=2735134 RepID=UPI00149381F4|nr:phosphate acyltransferase PlsX [Sphingomonas sp. AP4-R1]QJU57307.1 phosphate acyltransferase PlsX [Sphingomonas sp. AP4-R1]
MSGAPHLAIDAMGGDVGPETTVAGVVHALRHDPALSFTLFGDEAVLTPLVARAKAAAGRIAISHAPEIVSGEEKPSVALRRAKKTSMGLAIAAVKDGTADAAVSAGNTGALMATAKVALRTISGIDRPALAALLPTLGAHDLVMLDLGANTECDARNLFEFAIMGAAYSRIVHDIAEPKVRLLNIGTEEMKGTDAVRDAAALIRSAPHLPLRFDGFIEANALGRGEADVIVSDGFSGNIALKTAEGTATFIGDLIRRAFTSSLRSKFGFLLSRPAITLLRQGLDPNTRNGAVFLGLTGTVVKSHGSASAVGFANAIGVAAKLARARITDRIAEDLAETRQPTVDSAA